MNSAFGERLRMVDEKGIDRRVSAFQVKFGFFGMGRHLHGVQVKRYLQDACYQVYLIPDNLFCGRQNETEIAEIAWISVRIRNHL